MPVVIMSRTILMKLNCTATTCRVRKPMSVILPTATKMNLRVIPMIIQMSITTTIITLAHRVQSRSLPLLKDVSNCLIRATSSR